MSDNIFFAPSDLNVKPVPKRKTYSNGNAWVLALLLLLFVLPLSAAMYWMYRQSENEIASEELQNDLVHARSVAALVEQDFISAENILSSIAERPALVDAWARRDLSSINMHLAEAKRLEPGFQFVGAFDAQGTARVIVPQDKVVGSNFAYRDWYRGVTTKWQPYVSEVYRTAVTPGGLVVAVAVPLRDAHGQPDGILMGTYGLAQLTEKFGAIKKGAISDFNVVDQHGVVAAGREIETQSEPTPVRNSVAAARALAGEEGSERLHRDSGDAFIGFAPVSRLRWGVTYSRPVDVALAPAVHVKEKVRSIGTYLLLIYLATAAMAAVLMRRQSRVLDANLALNRELQERITEIKLAREELDRYFTLSIDLLAILGADGYFKRVNPAWTRALGYSMDELLSKPRLDFVHPEDRQATIAEQNRLQEGRATISFENRYRCKDGSYKWLSWHATPCAELGLIYAIARDTTELKLAQQEMLSAKEEAERSNKFKDQFLSTMSHELRTPLNAVVGFSDLLGEQHYGPLNEKQQRYVKHIHTGGQHLLRLINDILDLSKIQAGRLQLSIENVGVEAAISDVVEALRSLADQKHLTVVQHPASDLSVKADSTRFRQILLNLLGNAIKFTPELGVIELAAYRSGEFVRVEVRDSGPGIPKDEQNTIFEAFYRLGRNEKAAEGTGLGLAISRRLVELQKGSIQVESSPGAGSCFHFTLPLVPTLPKEENLALSGPRTGRAPRVLVVEDDPTAVTLLEHQMSAAGYEVIVCDDPCRVLEMTAELQPDVVTMDVVMAPLGGWELLPQLKSDPRTASTPVIIVSIINEQAVGALLGADEYIVKPVERGALLSALERCLRRLGRHRSMGGQITLVEDDAPTRELVSELLAKQGYRVSIAGNIASARAQVAASLPEVIILDLILPDGSALELLGEWRSEPRTANVPIFILTSKDLNSQERDFLGANASALFRKQELWQDALLKQLHRAAPPVLVEHR